MSDPQVTSAQESASVLALALLDELRVRVFECLLVVEALPDEVDLNFDELIATLDAVRQTARQAFGAASLLYQGAALDERWGHNCSRPRAIFARHNAAARNGAHKVFPTQSVVDVIERWLQQPPPVDSSRNVLGPRPRCSAVKQTATEPCRSSAVYLGAGLFAAHCYPHATGAEREKYREHQMAVNAALQRADDDRTDLLRNLGVVIAAEWAQRRELDRPWLAMLALQAKHPT